MDPAVAALDFVKAGAILANMIESYLAGGAPPADAEGADHDDLQNCRSPSIAASLHLHSSIFFSSRRRHTRSLCDWSSDVCSSDLYLLGSWLSAEVAGRDGVIMLPGRRTTNE